MGHAKYVARVTFKQFHGISADFAKSKALQHYWETVPLWFRSAESEAGTKVMPEDFRRMGFKVDVYVNTDDLKDITNIR